MVGELHRADRGVVADNSRLRDNADDRQRPEGERDRDKERHAVRAELEKGERQRSANRGKDRDW